MPRSVEMLVFGSNSGDAVPQSNFAGAVLCLDSSGSSSTLPKTSQLLSLCVTC